MLPKPVIHRSGFGKRHGPPNRRMKLTCAHELLGKVFGLALRNIAERKCIYELDGGMPAAYSQGR